MLPLLAYSTLKEGRRQFKSRHNCSTLVSQFDKGLWQQWPLPSTEICFWHITAHFTARRRVIDFYKVLGQHDIKVFNW